MGETTCSHRSCSARWFAAGAVIAALVVAAPAPARAGKKKALEYYAQGSVAYNVGQFEKAITLFTNAYEQHQAPSFLFNIAQSHRQMGHCKRALFFYGRYLTLDPRADNRELVEQHIAELGRTCKASTPGDGAPTPAVVDPVDPPSTAGPTIEPTPVVDDTPVSSGAPQIVAGGGADEQPTPTEVQHTTAGAERPAPISGFAEIGPSFVTVADLEIPTQVSFHFGGDYHIIDYSGVAIGAGLGITITPMPWDDRGTSGTAFLYSVTAGAKLSRALAPRLRGRAQVGLGVAFFTGIADVVEQPFTEPGFVADGIISMATLRIAVGAEYDLAPNFVATASPVVFAVTSEPTGMAGSFRRFEMLAGLTYQF